MDSGDARELAAQALRELGPQVYARLEESVGWAAQDFEAAAACAVDRQLVRLTEEKQRVAHDASLQIEAAAAEARALLQRAANVALDEFRRQVGVQIDLTMSEATQRMTSSLASLDAACDARRRALESDVSRTAEQSTQEFRTGIKAFLYSCLVAAVSAVDEHAKSTLNGLGKSAAILPRQFMPLSGPSGRARMARRAKRMKDHFERKREHFAGHCEQPPREQPLLRGKDFYPALQLPCRLVVPDSAVVHEEVQV